MTTHTPKPRRLALTTLTALALLAPAAAADPGAVDRTFGGGDGVVPLPDESVIYGVAPIPGNRIVVDTEFTGPLRLLAPTGRITLVPSPGYREFSKVLPDGRFVSVELRPTGQSVVRRLRSGRLDRSFGAGDGRVPLPSGWSVGAVGDDGRVALTGGNRDAPRVRVLRSTGADDATFGERELVANIDGGAFGRLVAFDRRGQVVVATTVSGRGSLQRFAADGAEDPRVGRRSLPVRPYRLAVAPSGGILLSGTGMGIQHVLLSEDGSSRELPVAVKGVLDEAQALTYDRQERILVADGTSLRRISADGQRVELLRRRLPGRARERQIDRVAVDAQGRIVLGGSRLIGDGISPDECPDICREDVAESEALVIRLEGGTRRITVARSARGPVTVRCLAAARTRCTGSLTLRAAGRPTTRRTVRLRPRGTARFRVPRALRGARAITAEVRIFDGTGELSTARRVLRR